MIKTAKEIAWRVLKPMNNFRWYDGKDKKRAECPSLLKLSPKEEIIGVYENDGGKAEGNIVVTSEAILILEKEPRRIGYDQISRVLLPNKSLNQVEILTIETKNGARQPVTIAGRDDRFSNAFEFSRFLQRVCSLDETGN